MVLLCLCNKLHKLSSFVCKISHVLMKNLYELMNLYDIGHSQGNLIPRVCLIFTMKFQKHESNEFLPKIVNPMIFDMIYIISNYDLWYMDFKHFSMIFIIWIISYAFSLSLQVMYMIYVISYGLLRQTYISHGTRYVCDSSYDYGIPSQILFHGRYDKVWCMILKPFQDSFWSNC